MGWIWLLLLLVLACLAIAACACILPFRRPKKADRTTRVQQMDRATRVRLNSVKFTSKLDTPCGDYAYIAETGQESFARRIELVRAAQLTVDMTVYTIKPGVTGELFFTELLRAADRGVRVRILLGGKTNKLRRFRPLYTALRGHPNIQLREFNPFHPFQPAGWNVMMHDKFIIADGKALSLGGRNFGDEYCQPPGYCGNVTHDREVFVLGAKPQSVVRQVIEYFEDLWQHPATRVLHHHHKPIEKICEALYRQTTEFETEQPSFFRAALPLGQMVVPTRKATLVHNPITLDKKDPWVGWQLYRIARMGKTVWLQTPYMTDSPEILENLARVTQTAELNILTNSLKSSPNLPAFSVYAAARKRFLATGAVLHEYAAPDGSSIHGKSLAVDDSLCAIGSFNLDDRSLFIDTETMLVFHSAELTAMLRSRMDLLAAQSAVVQPDNRYAKADSDKLPKPGKRRLFALAAHIFRPLRFLV